MSTINYIHQTEKISNSLSNRISEGLVRIEDILTDGKIYGAITPIERNTIKSLVKESQKSGLTYEDSVLSLTEYFKQRDYKLKEYTSVGPSGPATTANANVAPAAGNTVTNKPLDSKGIDAMAQMLRNAGLSQSQLNQVTNKAKQGI